MSGQNGDGLDNAWEEGSDLGMEPGEVFVDQEEREVRAEIARMRQVAEYIGWSADSANPKDIAGASKPRMGLIPVAAMDALARVMELGAKKYGPYNWRTQPIKNMVYAHAALRHLFAWISGQSIDPESGQSHLAHVASCMMIVLDAEATGNCIEDRAWIVQPTNEETK